jgi:O-antigen/teichoic acid export membrane protein
MSTFNISLKRVFRNFAANAFGQAMSGVYQFISVPLFLHYWNKQGYGEWLVLFSIPSLLWSLEGGLAGVASSRMTLASSSGNWELANSLFQNILLIQSIFCLVFMGMAVYVASTFKLAVYFGFTQISNADTSMIMLLLIAYMLTAFCQSLTRAAYRASEIEARGVMANNLWRMAEFCLVAVVLYMHGNPVLLAECMLVCVMISTAVVFLDVRRTCPHVEFGISRASWSQAKSIFIDGLPLLSGQAAAALSLQGYPLIINRALGASFVVTFVTIRTVSRMVLLFINVVSFSSAPELSRSYGRKDWLVYVRLLKIMLTCALCGGAVTLLVLTIGGPFIIGKWTAGKIVVTQLPMFLFAVSIAMQGLWAIGGVVLVASNMHHLFNYTYLCITAGGLLLASQITPLVGFTGIPATMVVQDSLLILTAILLCQSKLSHISIKDVGTVFTFGFYRKHIKAARNRFSFANSK